MSKIKKPASLDLSTGNGRNRKGPKSAILESPDLKMLGLTSPELENMIIQMSADFTSNGPPIISLTPCEPLTPEQRKKGDKEVEETEEIVKVEETSNSIKDVKDAKVVNKETSGSVSLVPIDILKQEESKLERKRERNRIAAEKCRRKKVERIAFLENKKEQLTKEKSELQSQLDKLKARVNELNQELLLHISTGCTKNLPLLQNLGVQRFVRSLK